MDVDSVEEIIETRIERVVEPPSVFELPWTDEQDREYRHKKKGFLVVVSNKAFSEGELKSMKNETIPEESRIYKNRYGTFLGKYIVEALRNTIMGVFPDYSAQEVSGEGPEGEEAEGDLARMMKEPPPPALKPQEARLTDESSGNSEDDNSDNAMDYYNYDTMDEDEVDEEESEVELGKKKDPARAYLESSDSVYTPSSAEEPPMEDENEDAAFRPLVPLLNKKNIASDLPVTLVDRLHHETSSSEDDGGFLFDAPGPDFRQRVMTMNQWKMKLPKIKNKVKKFVDQRNRRRKTELGVFHLPLVDQPDKSAEANQETLHHLLEEMQEQVQQRQVEVLDTTETTPQQLVEAREARRSLIQARRENRVLATNPNQPTENLGLGKLRGLLQEPEVEDEEEPEVGLEDVEGGGQLFAEIVGEGKPPPGETEEENENENENEGERAGNWSTPTDSERDSLDVEMEELTEKQKREIKNLRKQKWNLFDKIKDHWLISTPSEKIKWETEKQITADSFFIMDYTTLLSAVKLDVPDRNDAGFLSNRHIFPKHPIGYLAQSRRVRTWPASLRRKGPAPSRVTKPKRSKFPINLDSLKNEMDSYETWTWAMEGKLKVDEPFQELEDLARQLHAPPPIQRQKSPARSVMSYRGEKRTIRAIRPPDVSSSEDGELGKNEQSHAEEDSQASGLVVTKGADERLEVSRKEKAHTDSESVTISFQGNVSGGKTFAEDEVLGLSAEQDERKKTGRKAEIIVEALKNASLKLEETIQLRRRAMNQISNLIKNQLLEHDHQVLYERYELKLPKDSSVQKAFDMFHVITTSKERSLGTGGDKRVIEGDSLKDRRNLLLSSGTVIFDITQSRHDLYEAWWFLKELITRMEDDRNELERRKKEQEDRMALTIRPDDPFKTPDHADAVVEPIVTETNRPIQHIILLTNFLTWTNSPEDIKTNVNEVNFLKRKPHPDYRDYFTLENFIYKLGVNRHFNLRTTVIHCGIPIGHEEDILMFLFKEAWDNATEIPLWGTGKNIPPLIHVDDLTKVIIESSRFLLLPGYTFILHQLLAKIIVSKSYPLLVFAISRSEQTLTQISKQVAMRFGFSRIRPQPNDDYEWKNKLPKIVHDLLRQNIKLQYIAIHPFMESSKFQSPFGLQTDEVVGELKKSRKLAALTVLLLGPPSKIKTEAAEIISDFYDIPVINKRSIIDDVMRAAQNAKDAAFIEKEEKQAKELDPEPEEPPPRDASLEEMKILSKAQYFDVNRGWLTLSLKTLLESVHVKTHGYILLDFPSRYSDSEYLFSMKPPTTAKGAEGEAAGAGVAPPQFIIHIDGPKEFFERQEVYTTEIHRRIGDEIKEDMQEYLELKAKNEYSLRYFQEMNFKIHWLDMCENDVLSEIFQILGPPRVPGGLEKFVECMLHVKSLETHGEYRQTFREYQDQIFSTWQKFDINAALQSFTPRSLAVGKLDSPDVEPVYYARPKFKNAKAKRKLRAKAAGYKEMTRRWLEKSPVFTGLTSVGERQHWNTLRELWDEKEVANK